MPPYSDAPTVSLPRPGPALKGVLITLLALWLMFAVGINWAGVPRDFFDLLCGNARRILQGEIWRLFTASLMHEPSGSIGHILTALFGLYFLGPTLEKEWGAQRFLRFLLLSVCRHVPMERKNAERHVLLHHADDALFHHPHQLHISRHAAWPKLVNACSERK